MTLYTRRQILVLLVLLAIAGFGLAVGHWRRARPDAVDYLEQLDRAPAPSSTAPRSGDAPPSSTLSAPEPRPARRAKEPRESQRPQGAPAADTPADTIDLNRATTVELTRLPGIGPALARRIVDARDADGPFARVEELERIRGMSLRKVEKLRAFVTITR